MDCTVAKAPHSARKPLYYCDDPVKAHDRLLSNFTQKIESSLRLLQKQLGNCNFASTHEALATSYKMPHNKYVYDGTATSISSDEENGTNHNESTEVEVETIPIITTSKRKRKRDNVELNRTKPKTCKSQQASNKPVVSKRAASKKALKVDARLKVYYESYDKWFPGTVADVQTSENQVLVAYDDKDSEWMDPTAGTWKLTKTPKQQSMTPGRLSKIAWVEKQHVGDRLVVYCPRTKDRRNATLREINHKWNNPHARNAPHRIEYDIGGGEWTNLVDREFSRIVSRAKHLKPGSAITIMSYDEDDNEHADRAIVDEIDSTRVKPHLVRYEDCGSIEWVNLCTLPFHFSKSKATPATEPKVMLMEPVLHSPPRPPSSPFKKQLLMRASQSFAAKEVAKSSSSPTTSLDCAKKHNSVAAAAGAAPKNTKIKQVKRVPPKRRAAPKWDVEAAKRCRAKVASGTAAGGVQPVVSPPTKWTVQEDTKASIQTIAAGDQVNVEKNDQQNRKDQMPPSGGTTFPELLADAVFRVCKPDDGELRPAVECCQHVYLKELRTKTSSCIRYLPVPHL